MKKKTSTEKAEALVRGILSHLGENPNREGLKSTPSRVVRSWSELFKGYRMNPKDVLGTTFEKGHYDQMVICRGIEMYSTCEHHMIPFHGSVDIGYIPGKRVVGLSKLARLVEVFSRRLQIQEQMTDQICHSLHEHLKPRGVMVVVRAKHLCMCARGVGKQNSEMVTSSILGLFKTSITAREEFLALTVKIR